MLDIYDLILVVDLKREVFTYLQMKDLLNLQLVDSKFYEIVENDEILWNRLSERYFGAPLDRDDVQTSGRKRFLLKSRVCTSTELSLVNPIPEDLFSDKKLRERSCEIRVRSRNYPFKTNLLPVENMKSEHDDSLPTSSLIFENYVESPPSERDLKIMRTIHRLFAFLIFMSEVKHSDGEGINFCDELLLNSGLGSEKTIFSEEEMRDLDDNDDVSSQTVLVNKMIEKCVERSKTHDFSKLETLFTSEKAEDLYLKHIRNPNSLIHSVVIDYQPQRNLIYGYWNFRETKDPVKRLMTCNLKRLFHVHPWFCIYSSMKKVFNLEFLKKPTFGLKKLKEKIKMVKFRKQVRVSKSKKEIRMKWKTFFEPLEFRLLIQVGMRPNYGSSCNHRGDHVESAFRNLYSLVYFSRRYLNDVASVIIRNAQNSQIVFNFCIANQKEEVKRTSFFRVFDHAVHHSASFTYSNISETVAMLTKERKEEEEIEDEWMNELSGKEEEQQQGKSENSRKPVVTPLLGTGYQSLSPDLKNDTNNSMFDSSDEDYDY